MTSSKGRALQSSGTTHPDGTVSLAHYRRRHLRHHLRSCKGTEATLLICCRGAIQGMWNLCKGGCFFMIVVFVAVLVCVADGVAAALLVLLGRAGDTVATMTSVVVAVVAFFVLFCFFLMCPFNANSVSS